MNATFFPSKLGFNKLFKNHFLLSTCQVDVMVSEYKMSIKCSHVQARGESKRCCWYLSFNMYRNSPQEKK